MDLSTLKEERETLSLALKRWDDLLPPKDRATNPARLRLAEYIAALDEQIRNATAAPDEGHDRERAA